MPSFTAGPPPVPERTIDPSAGRVAAGAGTTEDEQQCGRCRRYFDIGTTEAGAAGDWWLCAPCRTSLFGGPR